MKIVNGKKKAERVKEREQAALIARKAITRDEAVQHNLATMLALYGSSNSDKLGYAEAEHARNTIYCMECFHTALAHEPMALATRTIAQCCNCACTLSRSRILKEALVTYQQHQEATRARPSASPAMSPGKPRSAFHDANKRVLQAVRRNPSNPAAHGEFICECGHKAKMHHTIIHKGRIVGAKCAAQERSALIGGSATGCGCTRDRDSAAQCGMADAESF